MVKTLFGYKLGMTTFIDSSGRAVAATILKFGPSPVIQIKTKELNGYNSLQIGYGEVKPARLTKPQLGHQNKAGVTMKYLREVPVADEEIESCKLGQIFDISIFSENDIVSVMGYSKGCGVAGVMKRHGFSGSQKTHGQSDRARAHGSIGGGTSPGRVLPGTKMAGHHGVEKITTKGLRILKLDKENNLMWIKGAVPGTKKSFVKVQVQNYN